MRFTRVLDEKITECSLELMRSYGVQLQPEHEKTGNRVQTENQAAVIGYNTGLTSCGSMVLWANSTLLERTGPDFENKADWLGELSNQLLGRILNKLLSYGLELLHGTPVIISGNPIDMSFTGGRTKHYYFTDPDKKLVMAVLFDTTFPENLEVDILPPEAHSMPEGETVLF